MTHGRVNQSLEPVITIEVLDHRDVAHEIDFILDAGFSGYMSLPPDTVRRLGLARSGQREVVVADGSRHTVDVYAANTSVNRKSRVAIALQLNAPPLVGMRLLAGCTLSIDVSVGGSVVVE